jgi:hypothetical protein
MRLGRTNAATGTEHALNGSELLQEAGALVTAGWCQGAAARDANGGATDALGNDAASWSLLGALQVATFRDASTRIADLGLAVAAIADLIDDPCLAHWNDEALRTQLEVVALLDRAEVKALAQLIYEETASSN